MPNGSMAFYKQEYNNNTYEYELKGTGSVQADGTGHLDYSKKTREGNGIMKVSWNNQVLLLHDYLGYYNNSRPEKTALIQTNLFTDRAIYRPGQTIYFKGIKWQSTDNGRTANAMAGTTTEITFYDANFQKIKSLSVTTNEFGSYTGSFTAPETGLTGSMSLREGDGSTYISVEEYKRPKFSVDFDTLKDTYALNETVKVSGTAAAFAGNNIDGATVKYKISRQARYPYWWAAWRWGQPSSPNKIIATGTTETDEKGTFSVSFTTEPDLGIDRKSLPVFSYLITADVTDLNGETRSSSQTLNAGYTSIQIQGKLPRNCQSRRLQKRQRPHHQPERRIRARRSLALPRAIGTARAATPQTALGKNPANT